MAVFDLHIGLQLGCRGPQRFEVFERLFPALTCHQRTRQVEAKVAGIWSQRHGAAQRLDGAFVLFDIRERIAEIVMRAGPVWVDRQRFLVFRNRLRGSLQGA